jgi:single-stranded DNA-binding protein
VTINDCRAGSEPNVFDGDRNSIVTRLPILHNFRTNENGSAKEESRWFQLVAFGREARFIADNVHKGTKLSNEGGELHYGRPYEDENGVTRTPDELHVIPGHATVELKDAARRKAGSGRAESGSLMESQPG